MNTEAQRRRGLWWISPFGLTVGFLIPVFLVIMFLGEIRSPAMTVRGIRYLDIGYSLGGIGLMALMALAALVGQQVQIKGDGVPIHERNWAAAAWVLGIIGVFAYLVWFRVIFFSPATLFGVLTGSMRLGRDEISTATGLSSLVNFMPVFFALFTHVLVTQPQKVSRALRWLAFSLMLLTLFRVYVWSERLAMIEVGVGVMVPLVCAKYGSMSPGARRLVFLLPIIGLPVLILYFGLGEFFRSWQSDTYQGKMPFWEFAAGRFATYYYTSLNNGAGLLHTNDWPNFKYEFTLAFAHKAPWLFGALFRYYTELDSSSMGYFLRRYADPEFNNPSGVFAVVYDLGVAGAMIYFSVLGFLSGVLYRAIIDRRVRGVLLFPLCFIMMLELYRYPYFGESRSFTAFLGAGLAFAIIGTKRKTG
jgi:hypothetical protein